MWAQASLKVALGAARNAWYLFQSFVWLGRSSPWHIILPVTTMEPESHRSTNTIVPFNGIQLLHNKNKQQLVLFWARQQLKGVGFALCPKIIPDQTVPEKTLAFGNPSAVKSWWFFWRVSKADFLLPPYFQYNLDAVVSLRTIWHFVRAAAISAVTHFCLC